MTNPLAIRTNNQLRPAFYQQQGAVLMVSLILLLLMTLIGTTGMQATAMEEKMAGNMRNRNLAFQAAESALKAGEIYLGTTSPLPAFDCTGGRYLPLDSDCNAGTAQTDPVWINIDWSDNNASVAYNGVLANLSANPRYIIENMGAGCASTTTPCPAADIRTNYRVTARATGGTTDSVVIVQSVLQL